MHLFKVIPRVGIPPISGSGHPNTSVEQPNKPPDGSSSASRNNKGVVSALSDDVKPSIGGWDDDGWGDVSRNQYSVYNSNYELVC